MCVEKLETINLRGKLFRINLGGGGSVELIYSYSSLIYSRVTHHEKKLETYEIPTSKSSGPKNYPQQKTFNPRNTREALTRKKFGPRKTHAKKIRTHEGTIAPDQRNLAHSFLFYSILFNLIKLLKQNIWWSRDVIENIDSLIWVPFVMKSFFSKLLRI